MNFWVSVKDRHYAALAAVVAGTALGIAGVLAGGRAEAKELRIAYFMSPRHPIAVELIEPWAAKLNTLSPAGVSAKVFGGGAIGGPPPGAYRRVVSGISDIEFGLQGYTSSVFPRSLVVEVPMQWGSGPEMTQALWRIMKKHVIEEEYKGAKLLAAWTTDIAAIMTKKPVRTPDDLKGLKIRTPSQNQSEIIKALGGVPVAMAIPELYTALEKGVVDGAMVPPSTIITYKLDEVLPYVLHGFPLGASAQFIVMNEAAYTSLPDAARKFIDETTGIDMSLRGAHIYQREEQAGLQRVRGNPKTTLTVAGELAPAERKKWDDALAKVVAEWVERFEKQGIPYRQMLRDYGPLGK